MLVIASSRSLKESHGHKWLNPRLISDASILPAVCCTRRCRPGDVDLHAHVQSLVTTFVKGPFEQAPVEAACTHDTVPPYVLRRPASSSLQSTSCVPHEQPHIAVTPERWHAFAIAAAMHVYCFPYLTAKAVLLSWHAVLCAFGLKRGSEN